MAYSNVDLAEAHARCTRSARPGDAGILLLPTIYGAHSVQGFADWLAEIGFTVLTWDPYWGLAENRDYKIATEQASRVVDAPSLAQMRALIDHMQRDMNLTRIGTAGFCMGGRHSLLLAAQDERIAACVGIYASIVPGRPNQPQDAVALAADIACPVQIIYPGRDNVTTQEIFFRLQQSLQSRATAPTAIQFYPDAEHGFMHRTDNTVHPAAIKLARPQIAGFLHACLD